MNDTPRDPVVTAPDVARLVAWIEAGEKVAQAATPGPWRAATTGAGGGNHWYLVAGGESVAWIAANDGDDEEQRPLDAAHIAAHDPAHELAVYAALRAVVDLHRIGYSSEGLGGDIVCCAEDDQVMPCATLRALVALAGDGDSA